MRNKALLLLVSGLLTGCQSWTYFELQPTEPLGVRETNVDLSEQLGDARLIVLSPLSLEQSTGRVTQEVPTDATTAAEVDGLGHTTDYNVAASAAEGHLVNSGYHVVSQAALAQYAEDGGKNGELEAMRAKGNLTLLEAALVLAPAVDADATLLVRNVQCYYDPTPLGWLIHPANDLAMYVHEATAVIDAVLVSTETKEVVWSGRTRVRARDLLEETGRITASSNGYIDNTAWHYTYLRWPLWDLADNTVSSVKRVDHPEVINELLELGTALLVESLNRATGRSPLGGGAPEEGMGEESMGEEGDAGAEDTGMGEDAGATDDAGAADDASAGEGEAATDDAGAGEGGN